MSAVATWITLDGETTTTHTHTDTHSHTTLVTIDTGHGSNKKNILKERLPMITQINKNENK